MPDKFDEWRQECFERKVGEGADKEEAVRYCAVKANLKKSRTLNAKEVKDGEVFLLADEDEALGAPKNVLSEIVRGTLMPLDPKSNLGEKARKETAGRTPRPVIFKEGKFVSASEVET